ncbi:hypothetical protein DPMN_122864 [Dreissena polymorpha]|uniref:Uncharacterized protein n=1 Tax=Dreissena polymorpha TaxID=45954 RepID=A0A9D4JQY8_DREPO|nr:hypothetical protein DPMN_122864 [Dreissena polymorpha]
MMSSTEEEDYISELLRLSTDLDKTRNLFAVVDTNKYKMPSSNTDCGGNESDTDDEISKYFGTPKSSRKNSPNPGVKAVIPSSPGARSTPKVIRKDESNITNPQCEQLLSTGQGKSKFVCNLEYSRSSKQLTVCIELEGHPPSSLFDMGAKKILAKVSLVPGRLMKQRGVVFARKGKSHDVQPMIFKGLSSSELSQMKLYVKICGWVGSFRSSRFIQEFQIAFDMVTINGKHSEGFDYKE